MNKIDISNFHKGALKLNELELLNKEVYGIDFEVVFVRSNLHIVPFH